MQFPSDLIDFYLVKTLFPRNDHKTKQGPIEIAFHNSSIKPETLYFPCEIGSEKMDKRETVEQTS